MTISTRSVLILLLGLFFWSCNQGKHSGTKDVYLEGNNPAVTPKTTDVVSGYMQLKDAFVATDFNAAKVAAADFKYVVTGKVDATFEKVLVSVSDKIIVSQDIEQQRKFFEQISELMYALAQNGQFGEKTLYKQYCPMAFNDKGAYWLSLDDNILNPYFGDKMLKCGYIEEIL